MADQTAYEAALQKLARDLTDAGKLVEAGWIGMRIAAIDKDAPPEQLHEMRLAFFAGAQHLFASIMGVFDGGDEPSEADMRRLDSIDKELSEFIEDFKRHHIRTEGTA